MSLLLIWQRSASINGSFTADAVLQRNITGSFTADAVLRRNNQSGSFTADAVLSSSQTHEASFTADAVLFKTVVGSFTGDAVLFKNIASSFTADASISVLRTGSFTGDAIIRRTQTGTFSADAIKQKTTSGSFTANAIQKRNQTGSITADAVFISFRGSFTGNAILQKTLSFTKTANAVLKRTGQPGSFTADSLFISFRGSITGNAVLKKTLSFTKTANAIIKRTGQTGSFTADATFVSFIGSFTANAIKLRTISGSFTANAITKRTQTGSFTADSVFVSFIGSYTADAVTKRTQSKSFTADALFLAHSFTASAYIVVPAPGEPGGPPLGTKIPAVIKINGVDITDDVMIAGATFTQAVNARPGQFSFEVKDDDHIYHFVSGGRVTLDIDNRRAFDGYLDKATVRYAFPVDITTTPSETPRIWRLEGPDLNILFTKRIVFDQVNPNADLPTYPAGTTDISIIRDFMRNYVDLTGDDITYDGIRHVGSPNPDADGYIIPIGSTWGAAMAAIGQLPGAVWGLSQDRDLFYEDDSTESAPFRLSDTPDDSVSYGYRDFTWTDDGTRLVNDAQVWGAGTGSPTPVYSETIDAPSVAAHGRWQLPGQFRGDMYRQATVDNAADSIVYGSPQNLHGGKDPYQVVLCSVKHHGLRAGMKVRFINTVHNLDKVIPIRRLTITFVTVYDIMYSLELTQEIDDPWYFAEFAGYKFPPFGKPPTIPVLRRPRPHRWVPGDPVGCSDDACGITDSFDRVDANEWGISDYGLPWVSNHGTGASARIESTYAALSTGTAGSAEENLNGLPVPDIFDLTFQFRHEAMPVGGSEDAWWSLLVTTVSGYQFHVNMAAQSSGGLSYIQANGDSFTNLSLNPVIGTWYNVRFARDATLLYVKFWVVGDPEPGSWTTTTSADTPFAFSSATRELQFYLSSNDLANAEVWFDALDVDGLNRCGSIQFDDFERTVSSGWGVTTPSGYLWGSLSPTGLSVSNGVGIIDLSTSSSHQNEVTIDQAGPWNTTGTDFGTFVMATQFTLSALGSHSGSRTVTIAIGMPEPNENIYVTPVFHDNAGVLSTTIDVVGIGSNFDTATITSDAPPRPVGPITSFGVTTSRATYIRPRCGCQPTLSQTGRS